MKLCQHTQEIVRKGFDTFNLVTTGTPAGVAKLAPGDRLRGRIERIGEMTLDVETEK